MAKHIEQKITKTLEDNYMPYAMSVIVSRAIPEIDGFKPSHRKLLYTMYKMNLLNGKRTKSANIVGQTMKLNPHGDSAIYETMVRLSRGHNALLHPFIDSKGNFGKTSSKDMSYAAARYTEAKLSEISRELFIDIEKNTVDFVDNYDGTMQEPRLLPTTYPNILVNNNMGIAVGLASNMASFNLREICDATIAYLDNKKIDLLKYIKGPDFSTGGKIIYDKAELRKIVNTGRGSVKLRARYRYDAEENCIEIYEIPYTTTIEAIIDKIVRLVKNDKLDEISDIRDETDLKGLKITLDLKRGKDHELVMSKLYNKTKLEDSFSFNNNLLIDGDPKLLGIKGILDEWIKFRVDSIKRKLNFEIEKLAEKLHLLLGLEKVLLDLDKAIRIIRETKLDKNVIPNLMDNFAIDKVQAEFVANIKLRNINKEYILKKTKDVENLRDDIEEKKSILKDQNKINNLIKDDLKRVKDKYGMDRKTEVVEEDEVLDHEPLEVIKDYNLKVFITDHNYLKKISLVSLRASGDHKLKDDDEIIQGIECSNKDELLLFSNKQMVYKRYLYEIEDHKASKLGVYLPNILDMDDDEKIMYIVPTRQFKGHMLFGYKNGKVQKLSIDSYDTKTNRRYLKNAYSDKSTIVDILYVEDDEDIALFRYADPDSYRLLIVNSSIIPEKSTRKASGVKTLRLKKGSEMIAMKKLKDLGVEDVERYYNDKLPRSGKKIDKLEVGQLLKHY